MCEFGGFVMLSRRDRERIKTEEVLRRSATQSAQKWSSIDYSKWGSLGVSILALVVSASAFYSQTVREVHDFRAIEVENGVLLINAGNRTEALAEASYLYSDADWKPGQGGQSGKSAGPVILKPGEAQIIKLERIPTDNLADNLRMSRHIAIYFVIVDTRTGRTGNKAFLEIELGVTVEHGVPFDEVPAVPRGRAAGEIGGAAPGRFDTTSYVQLYEGKEVE
jgi:hypothetical protein